MYKKIHILGASGAGTTTLGKAIGEKYGHTHLDTDDFFWEQTDPPFTQKREVGERQRRIAAEIARHEKWVLSGSMTDWGDRFLPHFDLVIYIYTQTEIRLKRLHIREEKRFGARIQPGGDMYDEHQNFLVWASEYDTGDLQMRSACMHAAWLEKVPCRIIRMDGALPLEENLKLLDRMQIK